MEEINTVGQASRAFNDADEIISFVALADIPLQFDNTGNDDERQDCNGMEAEHECDRVVEMKDERERKNNAEARKHSNCREALGSAWRTRVELAKHSESGTEAERSHM